MFFLTASLMKVSQWATELERPQINTILNRILDERELSWQQSLRSFKSILFQTESLMKATLWTTDLQSSTCSIVYLY